MTLIYLIHEVWGRILSSQNGKFNVSKKGMATQTSQIYWVLFKNLDRRMLSTKFLW